MCGEGVVGPYLPPRLFFEQRQQVGRVAVHLVRAGEYERRVGTVPAGSLEHVERAVGVYTEIGLRVARCPVVRGLGGGVNNRGNRAPFAAENRLQQFRVANVAIDVFVFLDFGLQSLPAPCGAGIVTEQDAPHIVVDAHNVETYCGEEPDSFGADQPGRASYHYDAHPLPPIEAMRATARRAQLDRLRYRPQPAE